MNISGISITKFSQKEFNQAGLNSSNAFDKPIKNVRTFRNKWIHLKNNFKNRYNHGYDIGVPS
jgi:hypothetical protein